MHVSLNKQWTFGGPRMVARYIHLKPLRYDELKVIFSRQCATILIKLCFPQACNINLLVILV